jgi:hypothetical protein
METKSITIQPSILPTPSQQRVESSDAALLLAISLMMFSTICILIYVYFPKSRKYSSRFNLFYSAPCRHCQYFSDNAHLKCAIHPITGVGRGSSRQSHR